MEGNNETVKAVRDERMQDAREVALEVASALYRKKGMDIRMYRVDDTTVITEYYVICDGRSTTQVRALADEAIYRLGLLGVKSLRTEGESGSDWMLVDFGDVILHVFKPEARTYYNLERLLNPEGEVALAEHFAQLDEKLKAEDSAQ